MSRYRFAGNASPCLSEADVTHRMGATLPPFDRSVPGRNNAVPDAGSEPMFNGDPLTGRPTSPMRY
jgi:hypothetical protein